MPEEHGLININMELAIPSSIMTSKEQIAEYLNQMLYEDPEFFGDFGEENISIVQDNKEDKQFPKKL
jgi:hypothetical protein